MISLSEFQKLDLRVGKILSAERVEGSDKLLRLEVNLGSERRQIVAGIAEHYAPDALIGREIVIVANLEPRVLKGTESQGMLLAADVAGEPVLIAPDREVPPGSVIK